MCAVPQPAGGPAGGGAEGTAVPLDYTWTTHSVSDRTGRDSPSGAETGQATADTRHTRSGRGLRFSSFV